MAPSSLLSHRLVHLGSGPTDATSAEMFATLLLVSLGLRVPAERIRCQANAPPVSIRVFGLGGGGGNAVNRMIEAIEEDEGADCIDFIACNTDVQALDASLAPNKVQLGAVCTRGLGAGGKP